MLHSIKFIICINIILTTVNLPQDLKWKSYGPPSTINAISINPQDSSELSISTYRAGVFKSFDSGQNWLHMSNGILIGEDYYNYVYGPITYDPFNPNVMYLGTGANETSGGLGLYKTTDNGNNWFFVDCGGDVIKSIEVCPENSMRLFTSVLNTMTGQNGIYLSKDQGEKWSRILEIQRPGTIFIDKSDSNKIYTGGDGYIYRSTDNGNTWDTINSRLPINDLKRITRNKLTNETFFCCYKAIFKSVNDTNFSKVNVGWQGENQHYVDLVILYKSASLFVATTDSGLYRSTNNGEGWSNVFKDAFIWSIAILGDSILLGTSVGFCSSTDNGETWNYLTSNYGSALVTNVACSKSDADLIYSSTENGLFKSTDGSKNWKLVKSFVNKRVKDVVLNPENSNILYAGTEYNEKPGLYKSVDGGLHWNDISPVDYFNTNEIEIDETNPAILFVGSDKSIWKSSNSGESWTKVFQNGAEWAYVHQIKVSKSDPNIIYASFSGQHYDYFGIYLSTDGGTTWKRKINGIQPIDYSKIISLAVNSNNPNVVYAGNAIGNVFKTTNMGTEWFKLTNGLPALDFYDKSISSLYVDEDQPSTIYLTINGTEPYSTRGLYKSTDDGNTWYRQTDIGLYLNQITCIAKNLKNTKEEIYVGTKGGGVFKLLLENVLPVELNSFKTILKNENNIRLFWITSSEKNNLGFDIERKTIYKGEESAWEKICFVKGSGTTTESNEYSYSDDIRDLNAERIVYRLKQIDYDGTFIYSKEVEVNGVLPKEYCLFQNYPNPFNPNTKIKYSVPYTSFVILKVYDILGREVAALVNNEKAMGNYEVDFKGSSLSSGIYFYKMQAGNFSETKKLILLR